MAALYAGRKARPLLAASWCLPATFPRGIQRTRGLFYASAGPPVGPTAAPVSADPGPSTDFRAQLPAARRTASSRFPRGGECSEEPRQPEPYPYRCRCLAATAADRLSAAGCAIDILSGRLQPSVPGSRLSKLTADTASGR